MSFFIQKFIPTLYVTNDSGKGFVAFIIPPLGSIPSTDPDLSDALTNPLYKGIFIFSACSPTLNNVDDATAFYNIIIKTAPAGNRSMLWVHNINNYELLTVDAMQISDDGSNTISGLSATLSNQENLYLNIPSGCAITSNQTVITFSSTSAPINFSGASGPDTKAISEATLDFSGDLRGCICFQAYINRGAIMVNPQNPAMNGLMLGFQYLFPDNAVGSRKAIPGFFPLTQLLTAAADYLQFNISIDPTDVYNKAFTGCSTVPCSFSDAYNSRRTYFDFTGLIYNSSAPLFLTSNYSTTFGATINLYPVCSAASGVLSARLVFCLGQSTSDNTSNFYLTPEGDFNIQILSAAGPKDNFMMCGMQGTEFFQITSQNEQTTGDVIRFISGFPALATGYPFKPSSPVGPPQDNESASLTTAFTTSWATLLPTSGNDIKYVSQPKGSSLFGNDPLIGTNYSSLFGHTIPGFTFYPDQVTAFPLVPYIGAFDGDGISSFSQVQMEDYERLIISPARRSQIGLLSTKKSILQASVKLEMADIQQQTITTPSGLLVTVSTTDAHPNQIQWNSVLLGQNTDLSQNYTLQFNNPDANLIEALQTSDLFLVASNATCLNDGSAAFLNTMSIGGWQLQVNVGDNPAYGDYKNIMIIKGKKGKLFNALDAQNSLIANPNKWTQRNIFSSPTVSGIADPEQMVNLSQWLQTYFQNAANETSDSAKDYFQKFNTIAADENWTGILFLRVDIKAIPGNLSGIIAGVTERSAFNAHHLAVDISPVKKTGTNAFLPHPSTMSGLIYYVDPQFTDSAPYTTLPPTTTGDYDFRLLTLKVLFENTAVRSFESYAQLTVNSLFGSAVSSAGDPANVYNNVLLKGSFQMSAGNPVYNLASAGDNLFFLNSNIINKVEITNAILTTLASDDVSKAVSWFGLSGFVDYLPLEFTKKEKDISITVPFDLFSFGYKESVNQEGYGLFFNDLGVEMTYTIANPAERSLVFNTSQVKFDLSRSTPRDLSLFTNFALDEVVLLSGTGDGTPDTLGYLSVIPDMRLSGVSSSPWYALKFLLNLGTPGELAGKVNLNAYLLLAWLPASTGTSYQAGIFISLPGTSGGASLISLQSVLKLSIGQIRLSFDMTSNSFLMMMTEIALKFLGLMKIPSSGSTLFYLFGNPKAGGKASGLGWYAMYTKDKQKDKYNERTLL